MKARPEPPSPEAMVQPGHRDAPRAEQCDPAPAPHDPELERLRAAVREALDVLIAAVGKA
jgi:hypothetical protein